jgi:hypothetical protein
VKVFGSVVVVVVFCVVTIFVSFLAFFQPFVL